MDNVFYSEGGCGKCNNDKNCRDCDKFDCSTPETFKKGLIYCYERETGQINTENKCSSSTICYISVDFSKSDDEKTVLEKHTEQGCGLCPKNNKISCVDCRDGLCNTEDFIKNIHFCWDNNDNSESCGNKNCYYAVGWDNKGIKFTVNY
uniref:Uncharacterized protein n=1 Tax=Meloidogyne floridensis TaxID=298350 RepID=A0A915NJ78_9BILA